MVNKNHSAKLLIAANQQTTEKAYWLEEFSGELTRTSFPTDYPVSNNSPVFARTTFCFNPELVERLTRISNQSAARLYMALTTGLVGLLHKYTGNTDIIIGTPILKQQTEGEFTNTVLILRNIFEEKVTFKDLLLNTRQTITNAAKYQSYPLEILIDQLGFTNHLDLFDIVILLENIHDINYLQNWRSNLTFSFHSTETEIGGFIEYNTLLYKESTIRRIIDQLENLLTAALGQPEEEITEIDILTPVERELQVSGLNRTNISYPTDKLIHHYFEEQVKNHPEKIAIQLADTKIQLTYRELNGKANQLARLLQQRGVQANTIVAMVIERSLEMIIGILAILKSGGAYLPIDPEYPVERIRFSLRDSESSVILTTEQLAKELDLSSEAIHLDDQSIYQGDTSNLHNPGEQSDLAYIIYTSGTTGRPKGVMIEQRNVVRLFFTNTDPSLFDFDHQDVWTMFHAYCFDFSVWEMYGALLYGGKLIIIPKMIARDPKKFLEILKTQKVSILNQTPSAFYNLITEELKNSQAQLALRYVIFGGEALKPSKLKEWSARYPETKLINMYGITETTVHVTYKQIGETEILSGINNIGRPIPTLASYIVDKHCHLLPIGAAGELLVGGAGVGRGYLNRPELTADKFTADPLYPEKKVYRSGDLVRLLDNGELEYLGRIDHQVKIHGFRIELGEIETRLLSHKTVQEAVVIAREDQSAAVALVAYLVLSEDLSTLELREHLALELPDYMIPGYFVKLAQLPLTTNGKVDRKNLPDPLEMVSSEKAYLPPRTELERGLVEIWQETLELGQIGIGENFFYIGGDSIKGVKVVSLANVRFSTQLQIADLYECETIESLALRIEKTRGLSIQAEYEEIRTEIAAMTEHMELSNLVTDKTWGEIEDIYPMSDIEKGMVFYSLRNPTSGVYHYQLVYEINDPDFDPGRFKNAAECLLRKHQILRTVFNLDDFVEPMHLVFRTGICDVEHQDLSDLSADELANYLEKYLAEDQTQIFDVTRLPLWRIRTFSLGGGRVCVILICYHAILDGWSIASMTTELSEIYLKLLSEADYQLEPLKSSYKEAVITGILNKRRTDMREFWREELADYKRWVLPEKQFTSNNTGKKIYHYPLGSEMENKLIDLAKAHATTLKNICFAAYGYTLNMFAYENDLTVGLVTSNRPICEDGERILGCFLNTVPIRVQIPAGITWSNYLDLIEQKLRRIKRYESLSLFEIAQIVGEKTQENNPIFDTLYNYMDFDIYNSIQLDIGERSIPIEGSASTNTLLDFNINNTLDEFSILISYAAAIFEERDVERLCTYFENILQIFLTSLDKQVAKSMVISSREREELLSRFNQTDLDYPRDKRIEELFAAQATLRAKQTAVVIQDRQLTYSQLNDQADRLAAKLRSLGVSSESIVAVLVERSCEMIVGLLGILKAGGAYLPIDPQYPEQRIQYMLADSQAAFVLTQESLVSKLGKIGFYGTVLDLFAESCYECETDDPITNSDAAQSQSVNDLAYLIYTSGSTGQPKGVMVEQHNCVNFIYGIREKIELTPGKTMLSLTTISFDIFFLETLVPLTQGLTIVIAREEEQNDPERIKDLISKQHVQMLQLTPSRLQILLESEAGRMGINQLDEIMVGGEAFSEYLLIKLQENYQGKIYNLYGPTETTVWSTSKELTGEKAVTIGTPIANTQIYIVDNYLQLQPQGSPGELCIAGEGIARGYHQRGELTTENFVLIPFIQGKTMYRTGDLAYWQLDGELAYLGRVDHQLKIRGFRIEPGEIERNLTNIPGIGEAVVIGLENALGDKHLAAYYVSDEELTVSELRAALLKNLPDYMIPTYFMQIAGMPLTPNGKINRNALPEIITTRPNLATNYTAPQTEIEKEIAEVWKEVLGIDRVGTDDNYFELGGNSFNIIQLNQRLQKTFAKKLSVVTMFRYPTIRSLAEHLQTEESQFNDRTGIISQLRGGLAERMDIAVIGMAGRFPGASNLQEFWDNLQNGLETISFFTTEELIEQGIDPEVLRDPNYIKAKGYLAGSEYFDAPFFNYSPREAGLMDPQMRIFHEIVWAALEDAGYDPGVYPGLIGLYAGASLNLSWLAHTLQGLSSPSEIYDAVSLNNKDFLATRIAYKLNLKGPAIAVQTACSTSLVAIDTACQGLLTGKCDMALAGGVTINLPHKSGYYYQEGMINSPDGHCRAFDAQARGTVGGDGAGVVVLKRLEDALADGDSIYAVIKGSAANNDGIRKVGYTAPSVEGQVEVIRAAQQLAGVTADSISYIEAHGTGTNLGDPVEIEALKVAFDTDKRNYCAIGSVKTNIGHLDSAAGAAGFIKTVLAIKHRLLPPSLNYTTPNPGIDFANSPFYVNAELQAWDRGDSPRRAGISSFGIGGTNAHLVIEESPELPVLADKRPCKLILLSAQSEKALERMTDNLREYLIEHPEIDLADMAYTLQRGRRAFKYRRMLTASDIEEVVSKLDSLSPAEVESRLMQEELDDIVFMFSGQGSQYVNMGRELYQVADSFRQIVDYCFQRLQPLLNCDLREILYPSQKSTGTNSHSGLDRINETLYTQPIIFTFEYALARLLLDWGVRPTAMIGHSIGEYVAACLAGVFSLEDGLMLIAKRAQLMQEVPTGSMLSTAMAESELTPLLAEHQVSLAAVNSSHFSVVSGPTEAVEAFADRLTELGYENRLLHTSHAFHSMMMDQVLDKFAKAVAQVELHSPSIPYISNLSGDWIRSEEITVPDYWVQHLRNTVRFAEGMEKLLCKENSIFVEIGPGRALSTFVRQHLARRPGQKILNLVRHPGEEISDYQHLLQQLGRLWLSGVTINWSEFNGAEKRYRIALPTYSFDPLPFKINVSGKMRLEGLGREVASTQELALYTREDLPDSYSTGRTDEERKIVQIFEETLGISQIGIYENFFELGGDSLKAVTVATKIRQLFNVDLPLAEIFNHSTPEKLAALITRAEKVEFVDLEKIEQQEYYPLSYNQQRLWTIYQLDPENSAYNITGNIPLLHQVNEEFLKIALEKVISRHESFRTGFKTIGEEVVQFVEDQIAIPLEIIDLSTEDNPEKRAWEIYAREVSRVFVLTEMPLFRTVLIKLAEEHYQFIFNLHHIISDGWSLEILQHEFSMYYNGFLTGQPIELPEVTYQYKDFAVWHNKLLRDSEIKAKSHDFWKERLSGGFPVLEWPADFSRVEQQNDTRSNLQTGYRTVIGADLRDRIKELSLAENTTMFMVIYSAFNLLLANLCNQERIVSGIANAGRDHSSLQNIVGYFTNMLIQKIVIDPEERFVDLLQRVDQEVHATFEHQNYPLELVLDELKIRYPQISVYFNLLNMFVEAGLTELESLDSAHLQQVWEGKFDLEIFAMEYKNGLEVTWRYRTALFKPTTIEYIAEEFIKLVGEIAVNVERPLWEYNLFDLTGIQIKGNQISPKVPFYQFTESYPSLISRFAEQVELYPYQIAVQSVNQKLTYQELNDFTDQIGSQILQLTGGKQQGIAILFEHDVEMIVGIWAVLKTGNYYIPFDPTYPVNRLQYMLKDSGSQLILTNERNTGLAETLNVVEGGRVTILNISQLESELPRDNLNTSISPADLAYVLYTSGSTGTPKGVMQNHGNVLHFMKIYTNNLHINPQDRLTLLSSYAFDAAVMDIFGALLNGASLYPYYLKEGDITGLINWVDGQKITIFHTIPTVYRYLIEELAHNIGNLDSVRLLVLGGEAVTRRDVISYKQYFSDRCLMINGLGPTESTVTLQYFIDKETEVTKDAVPVGYPVDQTQVYLLDNRDREARVFGIGELVFKSDHLAVGYFNHPEKTEEVFVPDPLTNQGRVYRTGDLGRRLLDGGIEFVGRKDFQVKIRGYRIELGEIEERLLDHPQIKSAVVVGWEANDGTSYLAAYLVSAVEVGQAKLREYLAQNLPDYMIPANFVYLDRLPVTNTGKIDRKALPEIEQIEAAGEPQQTPQTQLEEKLVAIWADILQLPRESIGVNQNFFELGGHSLKAIKVISRIHKDLEVKITMIDFFKKPTIGQLAAYINQSVKESYASIGTVEEKKYYPVSSAQKRLYVLQEMVTDNITYNLPSAAVIEGKLDLTRLKETLDRLIDRHETLRTSFVLLEGDPVQKIHDTVDFAIEVYQSSAEEAPELIQSFIRAFNLEQAPLFRVGLIQIVSEEHILLIDMHHIISDGSSLGILVQDFMRLYAGENLPPLKIQYKDYAEWQRGTEVKKELLAQEQYWINEFATEITPLNLPTDFERPPVQSFAGDQLNFRIGEETGLLKQLALAEGTTLYVVLLTAYTIFLAKISGQDEIVVGTPVAGRNHTDLQQIIGMFVNTLALSNQITGELTIRETIRQIKDKTLQAFANQDYLLEDLIERLDLVRDLSRNPLFDVSFALQNMDIPEIEIAGLALKPYKYVKSTAKFDLNLVGLEVGNGLNFIMEYCTKLFTRETIERFMQYFTRILETIAYNPELKISEVEIISPEEKSWIIDQINDTRRDYPEDKLIQQIFEENVEQVPEKIALIFEDQSLSYRELNQRANQLARLLRGKGVTGDVSVAIIVERSLEVIIGVLGILKAGGAYLPIDPQYPEMRKRYLLEDSKSQIILTSADLIPENQEICQSREVILLDDQQVYTGEKSNLEMINQPADLCYIIYTSGTTGEPKGVMVSHSNVIRLVKNTDYIDFAEQDSLVQFGVLQFDASTFEIWGALLNRLTLYLIAKNVLLDLDLLEARFKEYKPSILLMTTALFDQIALNRIEIFNGISYLLVGGEALSPIHVNRVHQRFPEIKLLNVYGPTENTTFSTAFEIQKEYTRSVPIGYPIANSTAYVVDRYDNLQPVGIVGQLYVGGAGVARGYQNKPDLTAEQFIADPFKVGGRLYKTGDLVKLLADGSLDFMGRIDHQVKVRGHRIELAGIESKLFGHPEISQAVVMIREGTADKYLTAYVVVENDLTAAGIKDYLARELPQYMVPDFIIILPEMPINRNGKIDRKALPLPEEITLSTEYAAPRNETEEILVDIWKSLLGRESIGINDNFFELGGHSLKATQLISKIYQELEVKIPLPMIFNHSTIEKLAEYVQQTERESYVSIEPASVREYYPLSSAQKRLYVLQHMDASSIGYNISIVVRLEGELDKERLGLTLNKLIQRHESLRTSFAMVDGEPLQKIAETAVCDIEFVTIDQTAVDQWIADFIQPFDLSTGPLFRVGLIELNPLEHILIIDQHHIISDGSSLSIFAAEFMKIYAREDLSPLRIQYKDYSEWQRVGKGQKSLLKQEHYWLEEFANCELPVLNLPLDFKRPAVQSFAGDRLSFELGPETGELKELARRENTTLFITLLAAFKLFLAKISGQDELIVGTPVAGRSHSDLEQIIGMFVNTLALKSQLDGEMSFREFLAQVKETAVKAFENQDYQLEDLFERLDLARDMSRNPLFDVVFTLQNMDIPAITVPGLKMRPYDFAKRTSKFDLTFTGLEVGDKLLFTVEYCTKLFTPDTIKRFTEYFTRVITGIIKNPDGKFSELEIISPEEKRLIIDEYNNTRRDYPKERLIQQLFEESVIQVPEKTALVFEDQTLSYRELNQKANQLARLLRDKGVSRETRVAIMVERSLEVIIGVLGILKAGGAYLPIDPDYPENQKRYILDDSQAEHILTVQELLVENQEICQTREVILLDESQIYTGDDSNLEIINQIEDLCYIIYTSGTTGVPKGVMVTHPNVMRLVKNTDFTEYREEENMLQFGVLQFDASTFEIWGALLNRMTLYLIPKDVLLDLNVLELRFKEYNPGIMFMTSALFNQISQSHVEIFAGTRHLMVGGEAVSPPHINLVRQRFPQMKLSNIYGPTENTTFSTIFDIEKDYTQSIPIGRPITNSTAYVVDKYDTLQPIGIVGQLYVGGDGVGRGYLNKPELTAERFISSPFREGERLYKTGDLVKMLPDGSIEFIGRIDHQVKIRGHRIELAGIESKLIDHPDIRETVVLIHEKSPGDKYLTAYVVVNNSLTTAMIKDYLAEELPHYMVPDYIIILPEMPLNRNGKIDRNALPLPDETIAESEYIAPETESEQILHQVWCTVLGKSRISINDNFFELGGHSIKAMEVVYRIHKACGVQIALSDLFKQPTIAKLAALLGDLNKSIYSEIEPLPEQQYYQTSPSQKRVYVLYLLSPESTAYNMPGSVIFEEAVDEKLIRRVVNELIQRHESLRTTFAVEDGEVVQVVNPEMPGVFRTLDISHLDEEEKAIQRKEISYRETSQTFDLDQGPLVRILLIKVCADEYDLIFTMHHIISDGASMEILRAEFAELYEGYRRGEQPELPPLPIQYKDFAAWQNSLITDPEKMARGKKFWASQLSGETPILELPFNYSPESLTSRESGGYRIVVPEKIIISLKEMAVNNNASLFMALLTGFNIFLHSITKQEDILIGIPSSGRYHDNVKNVIGFFINTLILCNRVNPEESFLDLLPRVQKNTVGVLEHQAYPLETVLEELAISYPKISVFFNMFSTETTVNRQIEKLEPYHLERVQDAKFDIVCLMGEYANGVEIVCYYLRGLFKPETIEFFMQEYIWTLEKIIANADSIIKELVE